MTPFDAFLQKMSQWGLEFFRRYYALYRADVTRVDDPESRGRVQIRCPEVGHTQPVNVWVEPAFSGAGDNRGSFWPPEVGDSVWVSFERGDSGRPRTYFGGWYGSAEVPTELRPDKKAPLKRGFVLRNGMRLTFSEESGEEQVELVWHKPSSAPPKASDTATRDSKDKTFLQFDKNGSITLQTKTESSVKLDADGKKIVITDKDNSNTITIDSNGVKIETSKDVIIDKAANCKINAGQVTIADGADSPAVRGSDLKTWLESHTHPTAVGPSGPPVQAPTLQTTLSNNVKVK